LVHAKLKGKKMTLKYMQGFETMQDDSDLRAMGWAPNPSKSTTRNVVTVPSVTGLTGLSLRPQGAFQSPLSGTASGGAAAANDWGYFNTGITVNQAWNAGGVTLGFGARFNGGVAASYGQTYNSSVSYNANSTACWDGSKYWAIKAVGSTYNVATSPDLMNWTVTAAQPAGGTDNVTNIYYMGSGVVAIIRTLTSQTSYTAYYTSNNGSSWATQTLGTGTSGLVLGAGMATGNATYPHAIFVGTSVANSGGGTLYVGTLGGTMTSIASVTGNSSGWIGYATRPRTIGNLIVINSCQNGTTSFFTATASNANLNTAGAWSTATQATSPIMDIAYNATSNLWILVGYQGIYTVPNSGAAGTPVALTGALTLTTRYSGTTMQNIWQVGTTMVANGQSGKILTSADGGITWVDSGGHILANNVANQAWGCAIYDGTRYVLFSDAVTGLIATTPDLQTNFQCVYAMESSEVVQAIATTVVGTGLYPAVSAPSSTTGQWTQPAQATSYMVIGSQASNARPVAINRNDTGASIFTGSLSAVPGSYHYYELHYVKSAGTVNTFTMSIYVDGSLIGTASAATAFAPTSDTTSLLVASFQRNGIWTAFDDMYVTLDDGVANTLQGPVGIINIVAQRPETDVQAQWVKTGSAASNSLSVNQTALSSQSANYVTSNNAGDKDLYSTTDVIPAGYTPKAMQVEAYYTKTSTTAPVVSTGIVSGGVEVDGTQVTISNATPTYVSQVVERNPNGSAAWTSSTVNAAQFANNHVS
jgi:hypothetical protein